MIYSNRKEIELKNANQTNVNKINNINIKETICMKNKEFIKNNVEHKQNSFLIKRENNINNYVLVEIINKKQKMNKNIAEMNSKKMNDIPNKNQSKLSHRNNNENININNSKNENISNNININNINTNFKIESQNELKLNKANLIAKEERKDSVEKEEKKEIKQEKESKKENNNNVKKKSNSKINIIKEKDTKIEPKVEDKKDKEKEKEKEKEKKKDKEKEKEITTDKKPEYRKVEIIYSRTHIRLNSSRVKEDKLQKRLKNRDNIKLLYTYSSHRKENNIKSERKKSSLSKIKENSTDKMTNHSLYICDSFDNDKKTKKSCYSKETNHKDNSAQKHNYSFRSINLSHSKPKKVKIGTNKKNVKTHLFHYFSSSFKKKSSINLGLNKDKNNNCYNKNLENILSKARNHKTISVQKIKTKRKIKIEEKEKIKEEVEKEKERDESNEKINIIKSTSNSLDKKNSSNKSPDKKDINKSPNKKKNKRHLFEINIKIKKDQAKEIKIFDNGKYEGIIINGKREKTGIMEYNDGTKYDGEWNNDKQYGKGVFTVSNTSNNHNLILMRYEGDFVNDKKEGKGIAIYSNGDKYEGEWKNNKQYGWGVVTYSSGGRYEGDWANGKFNGLGTYFLRNGEKYVGKFVDNRYNGYGKFYHINGDILEGIFINDQPNGRCFLYKADGTVEEHDF